MNPRVKHVTPNKDFTMTITFTNNEVGVFDIKPYLEKGIFKELKDWNLFKTAKPFMGTVQWIHEQDLCPDTLYLESSKVRQPRATTEGTGTMIDTIFTS